MHSEVRAVYTPSNYDHCPAHPMDNTDGNAHVCESGTEDARSCCASQKEPYFTPFMPSHTPKIHTSEGFFRQKAVWTHVQ